MFVNNFTDYETIKGLRHQMPIVLINIITSYNRLYEVEDVHIKRIVKNLNSHIRHYIPKGMRLLKVKIELKEDNLWFNVRAKIHVNHYSMYGEAPKTLRYFTIDRTTGNLSIRGSDIQHTSNNLKFVLEEFKGSIDHKYNMKQLKQAIKVCKVINSAND
jgi:hypothetical protein